MVAADARGLRAAPDARAQFARQYTWAPYATRAMTLSPIARIALVVLVILLILVAALIAMRRPATRNAAVTGGAALAGSLMVAAGGGGAGADRENVPHVHHPKEMHHLGVAMEDYARGLGPAARLGVHPLGAGGYGPLGEPLGGAAAAAEEKPAKKKAHKPWTSYKTWKALHADKGAVADYFAQRAAALNNPDFDWGPVLQTMAPLLAADREYIGIVNVEADGKTLRLDAHEASPVTVGSTKSDTTFASVPAELVSKYAEMPALFIFHTHPADPRGSPLPSSHDLSTALYFSAIGRYAASVVISRYGVLVYGLDWEGYKAVNEAEDWGLALSNLSHDVVAAHEAIRSWSAYTNADYMSFYPRHRMLFFAYPTPEMVAESRRFTYIGKLESPIDHDIITEHRDDIIRRKKEKEGKKPAGRPAKGQKGDLAREGTPAASASAEGLDLDLGLD